MGKREELGPPSEVTHPISCVIPRSLRLFPTLNSGNATSTKCIAWSRYGGCGCPPGVGPPAKVLSDADQRCFSWRSRGLGCCDCALVADGEGRAETGAADTESLQDEARREALKQRAEQSIHREEPSWEEDEGGSGGWGSAGGLVQT